MRIDPVVPIVPVRNDASTNSDQRISQKKHNEESSTVVQLSTHKSKTGAPKVTLQSALYTIELMKSL